MKRTTSLAVVAEAQLVRVCPGPSDDRPTTAVCLMGQYLQTDVLPCTYTQTRQTFHRQETISGPARSAHLILGLALQKCTPCTELSDQQWHKFPVMLRILYCCGDLQ